MWVAITWILILHRFLNITKHHIVIIFSLKNKKKTEPQNQLLVFDSLIIRKSVKARNRLTVAESIEVTLGLSAKDDFFVFCLCLFGVQDLLRSENLKMTFL